MSLKVPLHVKFVLCHHNLEILFYKDISYGLILIFILPLLDILGQIGLVSYSYLIGSIFAVLIFKNNNENKRLKLKM